MLNDERIAFVGSKFRIEFGGKGKAARHALSGGGIRATIAKAEQFGRHFQKASKGACERHLEGL